MKEKVLLFFKGMAMGAADVVPGVSGGTIAFISGIYEELLSSIKSVDLQAFKLLLSFQIAAFWKHINGGFLLPLFSGIIISIISLAKGITYLLDKEPILIWSFFFGLIIASILFIVKQVKEWSPFIVGALVVGALIAYLITAMTPAQLPDGMVYIFFAGSLAICAMILPGISGSFILLMLGAYSIILGSVSGMIDTARAGEWSAFAGHLSLMGVFAAGCVVGLTSFSRALTWMFKNAYNVTIALLSGFMAGSLNKVWPWKNTLEWRTNSHGVEVPLIQENVSPLMYEGGEPVILFAIILMVVGFGVVFILERIAED